MKTENSNQAGSPVDTAPQSAEEIAENQLGRIDWVTPGRMGYCDCPGGSTHTGPNGKRDCVVYLDHIPTLHCVHASCASVIESANCALRAAVLNPGGDQEYKPRKLSAEDKAQLAKREHHQRIRERAAKALPQTLSKYSWPYARIIADSPVPVTVGEADHWRLILQRFPSEDVVWIGDREDSGRLEHAAHFKPVSEWLQQTNAPGPLVCPVAFKNSSFSRSNDNVLHRRFLIVESDSLSRDEVGAVFKWLRDECGVKLVAIVDTGGKSLHAWYDFSDCEEVLDDLKLVLPALQCDPKLFTASQPVRLPGALRDGKYQKLVYLSEEVSHE